MRSGVVCTIQFSRDSLMPRYAYAACSVNGIDAIGMTVSTQLVDRSLSRRAVGNDPSKSIAQEKEAGTVLWPLPD